MLRNVSASILFLTIILALQPPFAVAKKLKPYQPENLLEHYRRAHATINDVNNRMVRHRVRPHWLEGDNKFWYQVDLHDGQREWIVVDCIDGTRQPAFDHTSVGRQLSELLNKEVNGEKLKISELQFDTDLTYCEFKFENNRFRFTYKGKRLEKLTHVLNRATTQLTSAFPAKQQEENTHTWEFEIRQHNAILIDKKNNQEHILTTDGSQENPYRFNKWSPDRKYAVFMKVTPGDLSEVHLLESSPKDSIKAKLHTRTYAQPGDRFDSFELFLVNTANQKTYRVDSDVVDYHGPPNIKWHEKNNFFTYQQDDRGHQRVRIIAVSPSDGTTRTVVDDKTFTFINQTKFYSHYTSDGKNLIWASERSGSH